LGEVYRDKNVGRVDIDGPAAWRLRFGGYGNKLACPAEACKACFWQKALKTTHRAHETPAKSSAARVSEPGTMGTRKGLQKRLNFPAFEPKL